MNEYWKQQIYSLIIQDKNSYKIREGETFEFSLSIENIQYSIQLYNQVGFYILFCYDGTTFFNLRFLKSDDLSFTAAEVINWLERINNPLVNTKLWKVVYD